ncbi:MAG: thiamine pyrophosphate-dependent enzyme [Bacteroidales bacterium]
MTTQSSYELPFKVDNAWCPGCGNFGVLNSVKKTLSDIDIPAQNVVFSSGIGQAAKLPQYVHTNYFNGLHGRALPVATAIKASNPELLVIAEGGDGDMYGEGGNHFLHTIRRNVDIVHLVHNNMVYGLTKGQASPTSQRGMVTPLQINGVSLEPANPLAVALSYGAGFVARVFSGDTKEMQRIISEAVKYKGYALIDIFPPCVSFNKINTYKWFKENTYYVSDDYDNTSFEQALGKVFEQESLPMGILYKNPKNEKSFSEHLVAYKNNSKALHERTVDTKKLQTVVDSL